MTAPDYNSAASDNSVFQATEDGPDTPANDRALVQIIEHAYQFPSSELQEYLDTLLGGGK